jgi:AcrR family transcriptional regulator
MGLLAQRLGVRAPSLYKHVDGLADLQHRIATLAMTELGDAVRDAMQGRAGRDALTALLTATRAYVTAHPGRYTATIGAEFTGPDDPLLAAGARVIDSIAAVLRGYGVGEAERSTPSAPSAAPCTGSPPCRHPTASSGAGTPTKPSTG